MKNALRKRITPSYPLRLVVRNADDSTFELNFRLSYDFNAMALVEEHTGFSMFDGSIFKNPSATNVSVLLWAGIQEYCGDDYTGDEGLRVIRSYLDLENVQVAQEAINEAFLVSLPKEQADLIRKAAAAAIKSAADGVSEAPLVPAPQA